MTLNPSIVRIPPLVSLWNDVWGTKTEISYWWHVITQIWENYFWLAMQWKRHPLVHIQRLNILCSQTKNTSATNILVTFLFFKGNLLRQIYDLKMHDILRYHSKQIFSLFIGREPTTWPANNCLQIKVCSCAIMTSYCVWLQMLMHERNHLFLLFTIALSWKWQLSKDIYQKTNLVTEW